ncbi:MAG: hypothetical protein GY731_03855, partial [Gammaproteobacteria bacterium]|nr:hypothetical protein [Gammaproteobacteria bacterium]
MKNRTLLLLALAIGFFYLCGSVGASVPYDDYQLTLPQFRQSNGTLTIYVLKDGDWQSQGALTLDKYYREKNIQLNLGDNPDSQVQIKLIQDGGGSAHIDAATLGGRSATALVPETPVGLAKLAARDFDVLHGVNHAIELVFDNPAHRDLFSITARIEAERLVEIPFQLPLTNMYKKMGPKSRFWSYPLDSHRATPDNSRHLDSIGKSTPFFKELLKAGSGHPSDYVYGWVQNDDDNLHVIMDLTGDNTMDGEKDYAKVYVNTPNGLKTFKITQSANQWGEPSFIYTDKVNWQHKVYTFRIPFEDIGLNPAEMDDTLELAFAAYGTLSGPSFSKVFTPDTIGPGSVSTLTFTIVNTEPFLVKELAFTDVLPAGVTIADPANSFTDCGGSATLSAPDGGGTITFSDSQLGVGESCTVVVDVTSSTPGMHSNVSGDLTSDMGNSGSAADDLTVVTTLPGLSKSFAPSSIPLGGRSTLTFTIDNSANESSVQNLDFTDNLPTGMLIADPADASTDCGTATLTATPGTSVITLDANGSPALGAGATCTVMVDVTATGSGELDNLSGELLADSVTSGKANATLEVTKTDLALVKSFTDDPVPSGGTVTLEFTIHNFDRDFSATGISFTDDLAAALTDLTFDTLVSNDCGGSITGVGTTTIGLTGGSVSPQANCTIKASLSVPTAVTAGVYTNTTGAISGTVDGSPVTGNTASDNLYVEPIPLLTKEFLKVGTLLPDPVVKPGGDVVLRFTITNTSTTSGATDIEFIDELTDGSASLPPDLTSGFLPFPVTVTLPPNPDPPCGAGSSLALVSAGTDRQGLELTGGSLAVSPGAGATCTFDVTVTIPAGMPTGVYTNTTEEISATVDGDTRTGEPASDTLTVISAPQLSKEFTDDPVAPGGTATLEFTLTYPADASGNATDITFTDDLAMVLTGLTANLPPSPDPPCGAGSSLTGSVGDTLLTLADGVLTPGQSCTFSLTLDVPAGATPGSYTNTTSAVGATVEGETAPALAASDDLKVTYLVFTKEFLGDPIIVGDTVTLRFTIDNTASATDATSLDFTDTLPTGVTVANPANASTTCIGGTLTAAADTDSITYTGGTV